MIKMKRQSSRPLKLLCSPALLWTFSSKWIENFSSQTPSMEAQSRRYAVQPENLGTCRLSGQEIKRKVDLTLGSDGKTYSPTRVQTCGSPHNAVREYIDRFGRVGTMDVRIILDIIGEMTITVQRHGLIDQGGNNTTFRNADIECRTLTPGAT